MVKPENRLDPNDCFENSSKNGRQATGGFLPRCALSYKGCGRSGI